MGLIKDILRSMDYGPSPEASEPVRGWLGEHEAGFGHFIAGQFEAPPAELFTAPRDERTQRFLRRITEAGRL